MAGIENKTARQFNLKTKTKNGMVANVRIAPGFNVVEDEHWVHFIKPKMDPYVAKLKKQGDIVFGKDQDDKELETEPDTKAKSKVDPITGDKVPVTD